MRRHIATFLLVISTISGGFLVETFFPLGDISWLFVIVVCLAITGIMYFPEIAATVVSPWRKRRAVLDMLIRDAIEHLLSTGAYASYTPRSRAEEEASRHLCQLACKGKIRFSGRLHGYFRTKPLTKREVRSSELRRMVVPCSPEAPEGHVWVLGPIDPDTTREHSGEGVYFGLCVDSRDIYKLWPEIKKGGEE